MPIILAMCFDFLHAVQNFIHIEVKKLNPDAILPEFTFLYQDEDKLVLKYQSPRKLIHFCEGLIMGLAQHTGEPINIRQLDNENDDDDGCVLEVTKL